MSRRTRKILLYNGIGWGILAVAAALILFAAQVAALLLVVGVLIGCMVLLGMFINFVAHELVGDE